MTKARKGETVRVTFKQGATAWFYLWVNERYQWNQKMCSRTVRQFVALNGARTFDVVLSTTRPRGSEFYHKLVWDRIYTSWRLQGVTCYAPSFLGGINGFISRRFHKSQPVYLVVYA